MLNKKVKCDESGCYWRGIEENILTAKSPFDDRDTVNGCPGCKSVDTIIYACDEPDCWADVGCGTPTKDGYRNTCGEHRPDKQVEQ